MGGGEGLMRRKSQPSGDERIGAKKRHLEEVFLLSDAGVWNVRAVLGFLYRRQGQPSCTEPELAEPVWDPAEWL